jgi:hypothetical protein
MTLLRGGTTDATTACLALRPRSILRNEVTVSSLVGKRKERPRRWRLEKATFVKELLMSTRMNSAGITRAFLLSS